MLAAFIRPAVLFCLKFANISAKRDVSLLIDQQQASVSNTSRRATSRAVLPSRFISQLTFIDSPLALMQTGRFHRALRTALERPHARSAYTCMHVRTCIHIYTYVHVSSGENERAKDLTFRPLPHVCRGLDLSRRVKMMQSRMKRGIFKARSSARKRL